MRVPLSWLRELVAIPDDVTGREVAERLIAAGLEVETVETLGTGVDGTLVVGRVLEMSELTEFKKPIRWCQVDVGPENGGVRGIICGAKNFAAGDHVVVALPGTVLPGGFRIAARQTYGHVSDGMICSERELGLGDDHAGIIVLDEGRAGDDAAALLGIGEEILDIAVTPDRGYALSMRGVARETATAFGVDFVDPGTQLADLPAPAADAEPWPCDVDDATMCQLFTLRRIVGFDPHTTTPMWMRRRLVACGMRPVSLAVDITNYVMLELGQPLHAFDGTKVRGAIRAGRAGDNARLETLDHVVRDLDPQDVVIRDDSGIIGLAGTMGGLHTEIDEDSTDLVVEAAYFDPASVARTARRHRLSSEASRRFERGIDRVLAPYASARATALLLEFGGGSYVGMTAWEAPYQPATIRMPVDLPGQTIGVKVSRTTVERHLHAVGCKVGGDDVLRVSVPSWRPDLRDPADLVEEVARLVGYDQIPSVLPVAPSGYGLTRAQRLRRRVSLALAGAGFVDVLAYPFLGDDELDALRIESDDVRRRTVRLANPLSAEQPYLRTTLVPGLLAALRRNISRGVNDLALVEIGRVFVAPDAGGEVIRPSVAARPSPEDLAALEALLPAQPRHLAGVLTGARGPGGWWGSDTDWTWSDAVDAVRTAAAAVGVEVLVEQGADAPYHPGRTARLSVDGRLIGFAGELHPRVVAAAEIPPRTCAFEIDLDALIAAAPDAVAAPSVGTQPVVKEDLALVVGAGVSAAEVARALAQGAGAECESVRLFDVYSGPQVPAGHRSLTFAIRLRAADRTLSAEEIGQIRAAALAEAQQRTGAILRT